MFPIRSAESEAEFNEFLRVSAVHGFEFDLFAPDLADDFLVPFHDFDLAQEISLESHQLATSKSFQYPLDTSFEDVVAIKQSMEPADASHVARSSSGPSSSAMTSALLAISSSNANISVNSLPDDGKN
jgi:hypothetical protein